MNTIEIEDITVSLGEVSALVCYHDSGDESILNIKTLIKDLEEQTDVVCKLYNKKIYKETLEELLHDKKIIDTIRYTKESEAICRIYLKIKNNYNTKYKEKEHLQRIENVKVLITGLGEKKVFDYNTGMRIIEIPEFIEGTHEIFKDIKDDCIVIAKGIKDCNYMFRGYLGKALDLKELDMSRVKNVTNMFYGCINLKEIDLSNNIDKKLCYVGGLINGCKSLEKLDIRKFKIDKSMGNIITYEYSGRNEIEVVIGKRYKECTMENLKLLEENGYVVVEKDDNFELKVTRAKALSGKGKVIKVTVVGR